MDKNNQMIELYKAYTQKIYDELNAEYKQKEAQIRANLLQKVFCVTEKPSSDISKDKGNPQA